MQFTPRTPQDSLEALVTGHLLDLHVVTMVTQGRYNYTVL